MTSPGRRPGRPDTRTEILDAARHAFTEHGYNRATFADIARRAGVDRGLVYHYFGKKAALFVEALGLPVDPRTVQAEVEAQAAWKGAVLVERFLAQWEEPRETAGSSFVTLAQAVSHSPDVADAVREFLTDRVWRRLGNGGDPEEAAWRTALVSSQLVGLAWGRYVMRVEPLASADRRVVARLVGPTLDRYASGPLGR